MGQTDNLNSKTERQTKFGTARLLWHIQLHSRIESEKILSNLIANNYIVHLNTSTISNCLWTLILQSIILWLSAKNGMENIAAINDTNSPHGVLNSQKKSHSKLR